MKVKVTKINEAHWDVTKEDREKVFLRYDQPINGSIGEWDYSVITDIELDIDISHAKYTPAQWVNLAKKQCEKLGKDFGPNEITNIVGKLKMDHAIRKNGKRMVSSYAGKDAVTGKEYQAGTEIIWNGNMRAAVIV